MPADDHLDGRDVDAEFAAIVAGWDDVPDLPDALTDADLDRALDAAGAPQVEREIAPDPDAAPAAPVAPPPGMVEAALEEGHFEPPPVQLPGQEDLHFWGIVGGLTLGPIVLLWMIFLGSGHSVWWTYAGVAMTVGGFALLVLRLPKDHDDDHDSGARL
ncbi:MAG: hypothetical protein ABI131_10995 [Nostocoides sp.]